MKKLLLLLALTLPLQTAQAGDSARLPDEAYRAFVKRVVTGYILPALESFEQATLELDGSLAGECANDEAIRKAFAGAADAWAGISFLRFGPMLADHRADRIQFWPDRKGIGTRQVQAVVAKRDDGVLTAELLGAQSVAMQGLPAFELLFFGLPPAKDDAEAQFRCAYGGAIARNLHIMAKQLQEEWGTTKVGYAEIMTTAGPDNQIYRTPQEAAAEMLGIFATAIQSVQRIKLGPVVPAEEGDRLFPKRVAFWRSGLAIRGVTAEIEALGDLHEAAGFSELLPEEEASADAAAKREIDGALAVIRNVPPPITAAVEDEELLGKFRYLQIVLENLNAIYGSRIPRATGLTVGFTALDGD